MSYLLAMLLAGLPLASTSSDGVSMASGGSVNAVIDAEIKRAVPAAPVQDESAPSEQKAVEDQKGDAPKDETPEAAVLRALQTSSGVGVKAPKIEPSRVEPKSETAAVTSAPPSASSGRSEAPGGRPSAEAVPRSVEPAVVGDEPLAAAAERLPPPPAAPQAQAGAIRPAVIPQVELMPPPIQGASHSAELRYAAAQPYASVPPAVVAPVVARRANEIEVSDTDFNRFVFPSPATQVVSPVGPPIVSDPLYMDGNRQALIKFAAYPTPIQMVFELEDGSVHEVFAKPAPIRGITRHVGGLDSRRRDAAAAVRQAETVQAQAESGFAGAADMALLEQFVLGNIPGNFEEWYELPPEVHFERFWAKPITVWTDGASTRVEAWRLIGRPGLAASIAPPQFYRPGVRAVLIEHDIVDGKTHPLMLVVLDDHQD